MILRSWVKAFDPGIASESLPANFTTEVEISDPGLVSLLDVPGFHPDDFLEGSDDQYDLILVGRGELSIHPVIETDGPVGIVDVDSPLDVVPFDFPNPDLCLGIESVSGIIAFADQDHSVSLAGKTEWSFLHDHQTAVRGDIQSSSLPDVAHDVLRFAVLDEEVIFTRDIHHFGEHESVIKLKILDHNYPPNCSKIFPPQGIG